MQKQATNVTVQFDAGARNKDYGISLAAYSGTNGADLPIDSIVTYTLVPNEEPTIHNGRSVFRLDCHPRINPEFTATDATDGKIYAVTDAGARTETIPDIINFNSATSATLPKSYVTGVMILGYSKFTYADGTEARKQEGKKDPRPQWDVVRQGFFCDSPVSGSVKIQYTLPFRVYYLYSGARGGPMRIRKDSNGVIIPPDPYVCPVLHIVGLSSEGGAVLSLQGTVREVTINVDVSRSEEDRRKEEERLHTPSWREQSRTTRSVKVYDTRDALGETYVNVKYPITITYIESNPLSWRSAKTYTQRFNVPT